MTSTTLTPPTATRAPRPDTALRRRLLDVRATLAAELLDRDVRHGMLGVVLLVIGSLGPAYVPQASPLWGLPGYSALAEPVGRGFATILVLSGLWLLIDAWMRLRPRMPGRHDYRAVMVWWSAPMLLAPPIFSHDAYSYGAQGWLVSHGIDPYQVGPGALPGPFADMVSRVWLYTPAPYGPLSLQIQHGLVEITSGPGPMPAAGSEWHILVAAIAMRVPALVGVGLVALCLPGLLRHVGAHGVGLERGLWFSLANPLMLVHLVGGAHNDALMIGAVVAALWLASRHHFVLAALMVGIGTALKQPAALAGFAVAVMALAPQQRTWGNWRAIATTTARVAAVAGGTFALVSVATGLGFGWWYAMTVPGSVPTIAPSSLVSQLVVAVVQQWGYYEWGGVIAGAVQTAFVLASVAFIVWIFARLVLQRPIAAVSWGYLAYALGGVALHGWYLLWGGLLLPLTQPQPRLVRVAVWGSAAMTAYYGIELARQNGVGWIGYLSIAAFAAMMWGHDRLLRSQPLQARPVAGPALVP